VSRKEFITAAQASRSYHQLRRNRYLELAAQSRTVISYRIPVQRPVYEVLREGTFFLPRATYVTDEDENAEKGV
jgi:hypothetical protein